MGGREISLMAQIPGHGVNGWEIVHNNNIILYIVRRQFMYFIQRYYVCVCCIIMNLRNNRKGSHMSCVIVNYIALPVHNISIGSARIEYEYIKLYRKFGVQKTRVESDLVDLYIYIFHIIVTRTACNILFSLNIPPKCPLCVRIRYDIITLYSILYNKPTIYERILPRHFFSTETTTRGPALW